MMTSAGSAFLSQNEVAAETLDLDNIAPYAEMHAGGLLVLGSYADNGHYVKMHDTWGPGKPDEPGEIVVHEYDPDDATDGFDQVWYFDSGEDAFAFFLERIGE